MKETKKFFDVNRLNKGYSNLSIPKQVDTTETNGAAGGYRGQYKHILPPMEIMAEYEELNPGTIDKILDMAQKEQNHRHSMDLLTIEKYNRASKLGRKSALILVAIIALAVVILAFGEHYMIASILAIAAFGAVGVASFVHAKQRPVNKVFHKNFDPKYKNPNYKGKKKW